jgi:hypothetical protein
MICHKQINILFKANAIDVPVWVERQSVDLKICTYDRLFQDTIVVNNRYIDVITDFESLFVNLECL